MLTTRTKKSHCKNCLNAIDAHGSIECEATPSVNDLSVCGYCAIICKFDVDLNLQELTDDEIGNIKKADLRTYILLKMAQAFILQRVKQN